MTEWDDLADWWSNEVADPAYETDVQPIVDALVTGLSGPTIDLGCGEGRLLERLPGPVFGCDASRRLLRTAAKRGIPVVRARLPDLGFMRSGSMTTAVASLVLEHLPNAHVFFEAAWRVVRPGGSLVVVANHPAYTAAGAGPVVDESDGETLWRWGTYLTASIATEPAGEGSIVFHHRSLAMLLNAAAAEGWSLAHLIEAGASAAAIDRLPALRGQEHMPRLVGIRWSKLP